MDTAWIGSALQISVFQENKKLVLGVGEFSREVSSLEGRVWRKDVEDQGSSCVLHPQWDGKGSKRRHQEEGKQIRVAVWGAGIGGGGWRAAKDKIRDIRWGQSLEVLECHPWSLGHPLSLPIEDHRSLSGLNSVLPKSMSTPKLRMWLCMKVSVFSDFPVPQQ